MFYPLSDRYANQKTTGIKKRINCNPQAPPSRYEAGSSNVSCAFRLGNTTWLTLKLVHLVDKHKHNRGWEKLFTRGLKSSDVNE